MVLYWVVLHLGPCRCVFDLPTTELVRGVEIFQGGNGNSLLASDRSTACLQRRLALST